MTTRTKIICTIGPSVNTLEKITSLIEAGMNVARINLSHGDRPEHLEMINHLKEARKQLDVPLAIMLDTKGPEIRLGKIGLKQIHLPQGHLWLLTKEQLEGDLSRVTVTPAHVIDRLRVGMTVLFDNGYISSQVVDVKPEGVVVRIENGGMISSKKGVNVPNEDLGLPFLTEKDVDDMKFGCAEDIDIVAASFVRSADQVVMIKEILAKEKKQDILVIAKIENHEGVENFDSIVQVADGIMIARGDLGVEVPLSQVPKLQKMMIRKSCLAGKPVVTATQMLESMINNPRPTRAETSDVANAIYDSSSAVMLSGETAVGRYPLETVRVMKSIIKESEEDFNYRVFFDQYTNVVYNDVPSAVTLAAVKTAYSSHASSIFAFTSSGSTARLFSRLRPKMSIVAMTPNEKCYHQMSILWGVMPYHSNDSKTLQEAMQKISAFALHHHHVGYGDLVVVTAGSPFGIVGTTNMMLVESIGDVLVRAHIGLGSRVHGNVVMVLSSEAKKPYEVRGQILVITHCDETYLPLIKESAGVILQNHVDDENSEHYLIDVAKDLTKSVVVRADDAWRTLKEGQLVTLDPDKALVYKGVVLETY
jgi:pyruvate kinase